MQNRWFQLMMLLTIFSIILSGALLFILVSKDKKILEMEEAVAQGEKDIRYFKGMLHQCDSLNEDLSRANEHLIWYLNGEIDRQNRSRRVKPGN